MLWIGVEFCVVPAAGAEQNILLHFEWGIVGKKMSCIFEVLSWSQKWLLKISFSHGYIETFWSFITEAGTGKLEELFLWILVGWVPPEPIVVCWCKTKILVELCGC